MQTKTTMRYHLKPVRMAITNNQQTSAAQDVAKGNPFALLAGVQIGAATVESSMEIPVIEMGLSFDPAIPRLGIHPEEPKTLI